MSKRKVEISCQPDYLNYVGLNQFQNHRRVNIFGNNPATTGVEDVWTPGGLIPRPLTAASIEVLSDNVNDTAAGTGGRAVVIYGLDQNYVEITNTILLNGTTPVALPQQYLRFNLAFVATAGSNGTNIGNIIIREAGGGQTRNYIQAGYGFARTCMYTVPAGHTLSLQTFLLSINRAASGQDVTVATLLGTPDGSHRITFEYGFGHDPVFIDAPNLGVHAEKTDIVGRCMYTSNPNLDVTVAAAGIVIANTQLV